MTSLVNVPEKVAETNGTGPLLARIDPPTGPAPGAERMAEATGSNVA